MTTKRWSVLEAMASARPIATWPTCCSESMSSNDRERFQNRVKAMQMYFDGVSSFDIADCTGVGRTQLPKLAKRCLQIAPDGEIYGFRALTLHMRIKPYERKKPLTPKLPEQQGSLSGALGVLFEQYPNLEEALIKNIRGIAKSHNVAIFNIRPCMLHHIFIRYLDSQNHSHRTWPFIAKYRGIRTITKYMRCLRDEYFSQVITASGDREAKAQLSVGTGIPSFLIFDEPYDAIEIDAYKIDAFLTVVFATPEGTEADVLLERLWLLAVVDRASTAVLSHKMVYSSEVKAVDVLHVIQKALEEKWQPMTLTIPSLCYPPKGGLPSGVIDELEGALWSITLLDGALVNLSKVVQERARKTFGFMANWGPPGHFERRPNVERCFGGIAANVFHALPSTTGSRPHKGRAPNAEQQAINYRIRASDAEQFTDVAIARHNCTPSEGISFLSPLEYLRFYVDKQ